MNPNPSLAGPLDPINQSDNLICMETTLTDFQRNFRAARAAADRGETVNVRCGESYYIFTKEGGKPSRPFADLEHLFGVIRRPGQSGTPHEIIRERLKTSRTG